MVRKHTVHTRHPRYKIPEYDRGRGGARSPTSNQNIDCTWYLNGECSKLGTRCIKWIRGCSYYKVPDEKSYIPSGKLTKTDADYPILKTRVMLLSLMKRGTEPLQDYHLTQHMDYWASRWENDALWNYAMRGGIHKETRNMANLGLINKTEYRKNRHLLTKKGREMAEKAYLVDQGLI